MLQGMAIRTAFLAVTCAVSGAALATALNTTSSSPDQERGPHRAKGGDSKAEAEEERAEDEARRSSRDRAREEEGNQSVKLEEVIVTAQKREESLQKAPLQVTAVTGEELQRAGITDARGLTDVVPGLEVGNFGSTTTFTIRGVTTNTDPNLGDSPTAFHIDGIYQGRPAAASGLFYDIARIEVLSGPQGTLYGKDSTGGTINVITNKPSFAGASAQFTQDVGNYHRYRSFGVVNVPVDNVLAFRVAFQTERHAGYLKSGYDDADDIAGRAHLLWRPSETFSALLTQDYFHQGGVGNGQVPIAELPGDNWKKDPWSLVLPFSQSGLVEFGFAPRTNNVSTQTSLQLEWDFGAAKLTSVSAFHHLHLDSTAYLNGTPSLQQETDSEISQELRLNSADNSKTKWVVGAYYHREHQTNDLFFYDQAGPGTDSDQIFPKINSPSYALFGQATYPILPRWRVTAGLRANTDQKSIQGTINQVNWTVVNAPQDLVVPTVVPLVVDRTMPFNAGCPDPTGSICPQAAPSGSLTARRITWRVGMDYDLAEQSLLFFNVSTGYKQGGLDANQPPNNVYRPETITAYEIGSKNRFFNDRLQVNLDAYLYNYKNYQVDQLEYFQGLTAPVFGDFISNAASARHKGVELETTMLLTRHDTVSLNVAYLSAVFQRYQYPLPAPGGNYTTPPPIQYEDLSGYTEFMAPRWTGTLTYQHTWEMPHDAQLGFRVQSHAESYYWGWPDHQPDSRQPGYTRTQLALQYSSSDDRYVVQAYVRNLENRAVFNNYTFQGTPAPLVPGTLGGGVLGPPGSGSLAQRNFVTIDPPRTYGVSLQVKF